MNNSQVPGKTGSRFDYGKSGINYLQNGVMEFSEWNEWVSARRRVMGLDNCMDARRAPFRLEMAPSMDCEVGYAIPSGCVA
jgi:hypothetical protein